MLVDANLERFRMEEALDPVISRWILINRKVLIIKISIREFYLIIERSKDRKVKIIILIIYQNKTLKRQEKCE